MADRFCQAVIFNLDGTLVDSDGDVDAIFNQALESQLVASLSKGDAEAFIATIETVLKARGRSVPSDEVDRLRRRLMRLYGCAKADAHLLGADAAIGHVRESPQILPVLG